MRRRFRRVPYGKLALAALLLAIAALRTFYGTSHTLPPDALAPGEQQVLRVVDGDTLLLANLARVRLIGVNAPESVKPEHPVEPWGPEASQFTRRFVASGRVRLEFEPERVDRFGRFLAYVWVDDKMLNEELVRAGLARYEPHFHYSQAMKRRFRRAQEEAQAARRGIWSGRKGASDVEEAAERAA